MRTEELLALGVFGRQSRLGERIAMLLEATRELSPRISRLRLAVSGIALLGCAIVSALAPRLVAFAQTQRFDVASVRPNKSGERKSGFSGPGGRFVATNVSAQIVLINAYQVFPFQISGAPGWFPADRFDVEAKTEGNPSKEQIKPMLQSLLADRFKLQLHREVKTMPAYELVIAKTGIKFKEGKCVGDPSPINACGGSFGGPRGRFIAKEAGIDELASLLSSLLSRS